MVRAAGAASACGEEAMCPQVGSGREREPGFSTAPGLLSALAVLEGDRVGIHPTRLLAVSFPSGLLAHAAYLGTDFPLLQSTGSWCTWWYLDGLFCLGLLRGAGLGGTVAAGFRDAEDSPQHLVPCELVWGFFWFGGFLGVSGFDFPRRMQCGSLAQP